MPQALKLKAPAKAITGTMGGCNLNPVRNCLFLKLPVQRCEPILRRFMLLGSGDLQVAARSEQTCHDLLRASPDSLRQIISGNHKILAASIFAPDDNMGVRVACIVVIDGNPVERCPKITLHRSHQRACTGL